MSHGSGRLSVYYDNVTNVSIDKVKQILFPKLSIIDTVFIKPIQKGGGGNLSRITNLFVIYFVHWFETEIELISVGKQLNIFGTDLLNDYYMHLTFHKSFAIRISNGRPSYIQYFQNLDFFNEVRIIFLNCQKQFYFIQIRSLVFQPGINWFIVNLFQNPQSK